MRRLVVWLRPLCAESGAAFVVAQDERALADSHRRVRRMPSYRQCAVSVRQDRLLGASVRVLELALVACESAEAGVQIHVRAAGGGHFLCAARFPGSTCKFAVKM